MKINQKCARAVAAILGTHAAGAAYAATTPDQSEASTGGIQEVIVTAQRRSENAQDVPIAIQAFTGDTLKQLNVTSFDDLIRYLPNVSAPSAGPGQDDALALGFNALLFFEQYVSDPTSDLYQRAFLPAWPDEFTADVAAGTLPSVSWMIPSVVDSEHASAAPAVGERFVGQILSILVSNPEVWAKTVVLFVYDENGGFFDHVAPPTPPPGTPGEELTVRPLPKDAGGVAGPIGLGFRVPAMVISPFSRGGYVCSDTFDHTSLLRFLETRFGVKVPNLSNWRRKTCGDLTSTLDLGSADTRVPKLLEPSGASDLPTPELCSTSLDEGALLDPPPALMPPARQRMPRQERGSRKRRG